MNLSIYHSQLQIRFIAFERFHFISEFERRTHSRQTMKWSEMSNCFQFRHSFSSCTLMLNLNILLFNNRPPSLSLFKSTCCKYVVSLNNIKAHNDGLHLQQRDIIGQQFSLPNILFENLYELTLWKIKCTAFDNFSFDLPIHLLVSS